MNGAEPVERIEAAVLDILSEVLEESVDVLREQPVLAVHEWDSITSLLSLSQLESQFGVNLDLRSYHAARTVGDLVELIATSATSLTPHSSPHSATSSPAVSSPAINSPAINSPATSTTP